MLWSIWYNNTHTCVDHLFFIICDIEYVSSKITKCNSDKTIKKATKLAKNNKTIISILDNLHYEMVTRLPLVMQLALLMGGKRELFRTKCVCSHNKLIRGSTITVFLTVLKYIPISNVYLILILLDIHMYFMSRKFLYIVSLL